MGISKYFLIWLWCLWFDNMDGAEAPCVCDVWIWGKEGEAAGDGAFIKHLVLEMREGRDKHWSLSSPERTHGWTKCMSSTMWAMNDRTRQFSRRIGSCTMHSAAGRGRAFKSQEWMICHSNERFIIQTNDLSFDRMRSHSKLMISHSFEWQHRYILSLDLSNN